MKTIFITIYDGAISKNVLRTDIFATLRDKFRIVLFVPKAKVAHYQEHFGSSTVLVEATPGPDRALFENRFHALALDSFPTHTVYLKIWHEYRKHGSIFKLGIKLLLWLLGKVSPLHRILRFIYSGIPDHSFDHYFQIYNPAAVFVPNMMSNEDYRMIKAARRRKIVSVGMPKSWDNFTSKTFFNIFPDVMVVQNEIMKEEAVRLFQYPEERITVVGFPQFDAYTSVVSSISREDFLSRAGLDPNKKTILYAAAGHQLAPYDEEVLSGLIRAVDRNSNLSHVQILVRPHPKYEFQESAIPSSPFVVIDRPGALVTEKRSSWEFDSADVEHLTNSLRYMDVLISTVSTLNIEGAMFNKPLISIGFDGNRKLPFELSTARYYEYDHMRPIVKTGGMSVAYSENDLTRFVENAVREPDLHTDERKRIVEQLVWKADGKAGKRVADYLIETIGV